MGGRIEGELIERGMQRRQKGLIESRMGEQGQERTTRKAADTCTRAAAAAAAEPANALHDAPTEAAANAVWWTRSPTHWECGAATKEAAA